MRIVENVFVDVTGLDARTLIAQHQKLFPRNVIARWEIDGRTYLKVPYLPAETKVSGMTREEFEPLLPKMEMK